MRSVIKKSVMHFFEVFSEQGIELHLRRHLHVKNTSICFFCAQNTPAMRSAIFCPQKRHVYTYPMGLSSSVSGYTDKHPSSCAATHANSSKASFTSYFCLPLVFMLWWMLYRGLRLIDPVYSIARSTFYTQNSRDALFGLHQPNVTL